MLDGEMLIESGGEWQVTAAGHVAARPRDQVHTFLIVSATARYLTLHTPPGFDAFVRDVSDAARGDGAPLHDPWRSHSSATRSTVGND